MKEYYERYWKNELPKDMKFFAGKPTWDLIKTKQHEAWVVTWTDEQNYLLDYGCGNGHFTNYINAIGTDISEEAVKQAKEMYPSACFTPLVELKDVKFDAIFLFDVLEHIFDFDVFFQELNSHVEKGGRLLITTNEMCLIKMLIIGVYYMDEFFHPYSPHVRFFTRKSLEKLLNYHGYKVIHFERVGNYLGILSKGQFVVAERE